MENTKTQYVAYFRVSTTKQNHGIDAQKTNVSNYIQSNNGRLKKSFEEKESGKNSNRLELKNAVEFAAKNNCILIVAKLDRLSREVSFIFELKSQLDKNGVKLVSIDLPDLNTLTLGIFATMAQHERELISKRTKEGLQAAKVKGRVGGTPANLTDEAKKKAIVVIKAKAANNENSIRAYQLIKAYNDNGMNWNTIAKELNKSGFCTPNGKQFQAIQVQRIFNKFN